MQEKARNIFLDRPDVRDVCEMMLAGVHTSACAERCRSPTPTQRKCEWKEAHGPKHVENFSLHLRSEQRERSKQSCSSHFWSYQYRISCSTHHATAVSKLLIVLLLAHEGVVGFQMTLSHVVASKSEGGPLLVPRWRVEGGLRPHLCESELVEN